MMTTILIFLAGILLSGLPLWQVAMVLKRELDDSDAKIVRLQADFNAAMAENQKLTDKLRGPRANPNPNAGIKEVSPNGRWSSR
jgi:hypothetical protein